ncbi:MAG: hydroxypyruvate isomerase family protein [Candidatus Methylacidiphilales bacterium]|nr:TIM barrel protein [Candidatus Methylacidiphilales bacterium]
MSGATALEAQPAASSSSSAQKGLRQSFTWWSFSNRGGVSAEALLRGAAEIGYKGVELLDEALWPVAKEYGLQITTEKGHGTIESGLNRQENRMRIVDELHERIARAKEWEIPILICFSGNRAEDLSDSAGLETSAETLRLIAPAAEAAGVILAVELLNSRLDHKGYQCDHTEWGVALCDKAGSPSVKLLYDIYHMQIMEGDLIRTIQKHHSSIAHYHTAGNPGRGHPDLKQEIYYPAIYRAIAKTGYTGFIGQEFFPEGNPLEALRLAYDDCAEALG